MFRYYDAVENVRLVEKELNKTHIGHLGWHCRQQDKSIYGKAHEYSHASSIPIYQ